MENRKPAATVSVIIPTFNRARYVAQSLESVLNQTVPPHEIIVVNDGCTDDTEEVLAPYMDRILYLIKENGGKSSALNMAIPKATGEYIWIFDDDDIALPDALERHLKKLEGRQDAGFTYSSHYFAKADESGTLVPFRQRPLPDVPETQIFVSLMLGCFVNAPSMVVRRSCYETVGDYEEAFVASEDYEMALRLARRYIGLKVPEPTFLYRVHEGVRGSASTSFEARERNEYWRQYDKKILRGLRDALDLHEYLPRDEQQLPLSSEKARQAFLQRIQIMARKGLWPEFLEDLETFLADHSPAITQREALLLSGCMATDPVINELIQDQSILKKTAALCRRYKAPSVSKALLKGLYYSFRKNIEYHDWLGARRAVWVLSRLAFSSIVVLK